MQLGVTYRYHIPREVGFQWNWVQVKIRWRELQLLLSVGPFGIYTCKMYLFHGKILVTKTKATTTRNILCEMINLNVSWPSPPQVSHSAALPCSSWVQSQTETKFRWKMPICQNLAQSALNFCSGKPSLPKRMNFQKKSKWPPHTWYLSRAPQAVPV